jgi:chromosome segregation ATPase
MDVVTGLTIAVVTAVVLITGAVLGGFAVLFRRRGDSGIRSSGDSSLDALSTRAGSLLVRLDDAVRDADDELGYAIAQFGPERARDYADALASARTKVAEAFRLKQALDDAIPDSERKQREWTLQIIALTEQAEQALAAQDARFSDLRRLEVNAAGTLASVRARIAATSSRVGAMRISVDGLGARYAPETFAQVAGNPDAAAALLATASSKADAAAPRISASGVSAVSATLQEAGQAAHRAEQLLDAVERTARDLADAESALEELRTRTRQDLVEARAERDSAPDADTGEAILRAMAGVESILAEPPAPPVHPIAELDRLGDAVAELDAALATARNQAQRLEHARAAYAGTLVSARSQISEARRYIGSRGGGVDARTRLAEAERQLMLAEAATDPVEALDTIRRAVTHARDADALARFDTMGGN